MLLDLSTDEIYEIKPQLIPFLVLNQTNKRLLGLAGPEGKQLRPLNIFAHFCDQDAFIRKISNKKIYESLNFESLIRGTKQK